MRTGRPKVHGYATRGALSPTYRSWQAMVQRCTDPKADRKGVYIKRGISVCDRWRKFENFLADMGERPTVGHSLDRWPNRDGNYEPGNVRWATSIEQNRNTRSNRIVHYRGQDMPMVAAAELAGLPYGTVMNRVNLLGWSVDRALSTPVRPKLPDGQGARYEPR